jgi:hypothetical protein
MPPKAAHPAQIRPEAGRKRREDAPNQSAMQPASAKAAKILPIGNELARASASSSDNEALPRGCWNAIA